MSLVVDVDSHWEITAEGPGYFPVDDYRDGAPDHLATLRNALAGDVMRAVPAEMRPADRDLLAHLIAASDDGIARVHPAHRATADERVAWMDRIGIDQELVNPGTYWQRLPLLGAGRATAAMKLNDYLGEQLWDHRDRLHGVAAVDFTDLDAAVKELTRVRDLGFRAFFLYTEYGHPPGGVSPGHTTWDRVWAAATDLGMLAVIHTGNTEGDFDGWANVDWNAPNSSGFGGLLRLANSQRMPNAQRLLDAILFGGVFARHPTLTVLVEEMWHGWLPWYVRRMDATTQPNPILGPWPYELTAGEFLRRNVRLTPLPGFGDGYGLDVLAELPEMIVFSSDYPHLEGNADPITLYGAALDELDAELRSQFLGENIAACFTRMGDPLR